MDYKTTFVVTLLILCTTLVSFWVVGCEKHNAKIYGKPHLQRPLSQ